jgi:CheY-like chemotaxis protein
VVKVNLSYDEVMKVLVIEDDKFLVNAYRIKFEKLGYEIRIAGDGLEALKMLNEWEPEILILDLVMPNMDGYEFLEKLRAMDKYKSIPVLISSNLSQPEDKEKASKLGANNYVVKGNLSLTELVEKLEELIPKK